MNTMPVLIQGFLFSILLMLVACNREDVPQAVSQPKPVILTNTGQRVRLSQITTKNIYGKYTGHNQFKYDSQGKLVAIIFSSSSDGISQSDTFVYNNRNQLLTIDHKYRVAEFGYSVGLSVSSRIYSQRNVYNYDNDNHIESITELADTTGKGAFGQLRKTVFTYDNNGFPQSMTKTERFRQMQQTYQSTNGNITSLNETLTYASQMLPFGGLDSKKSTILSYTDKQNILRGFDGIPFDPFSYFNKNFAVNGITYTYDQRGLPVFYQDYNNTVEYEYETYQ